MDAILPPYQSYWKGARTGLCGPLQRALARTGVAHGLGREAAGAAPANRWLTPRAKCGGTRQAGIPRGTVGGASVVVAAPPRGAKPAEAGYKKVMRASLRHG